MKTVILRSPETDRKKVLIPNLLTDMDDYVDPATLVCSGVHTMPASDTVANGAPDSITSFVPSNLINCDSDGGQNLIPLISGLFLVAVNVDWTDVGTAGILGSVAIRINGVAFATITTATSSFTWSGSRSILQRFSAGDLIDILASNDFSGGDNQTVLVTYSIAKIAP